MVAFPPYHGCSMNKTLDAAPTYVDFAAKSYTTAVDAAVAAGQRIFSYNKSVYDVLMQPYPAATSAQAVYDETIARADRIGALTVAEIKEHGTEATLLGEEFTKQATALRSTMSDALKSSIESGASSLAFFKELAEKQLQAFAKTAEEIQDNARKVVTPA